MESWTRGPTIGRGSSATVSVATANGSGEIFAVKSAELSKSEFLQTEQRLLSTLSSPSIIAYKGCNVSSEKGNLVYNLCMEYAQGGTLSDEVRRRGGQLNEDEIRSYARQILIGLEYLHSQGIVHCDVKGHNVLVTDHGAVKIADLGCARRVGREVSGADWSRPIAGTPAYMAPEVARGEQQGFAADLWALGCMVIEMATGKQAPWADGSDPVSVLYRIGFSNCAPEIPCFMSKQAKDFLSKCLKRDPLERWSASELLSHEFLEEPKFFTERSSSSKMGSPRSVLDSGLWEWDTEEEFEKNPNPTHERSASTLTAPERIRRLSEGNTGTVMWTKMRMDGWDRDEDWVTVRENHCTKEPDVLLTCNHLCDSLLGNDPGIDMCHTTNDCCISLNNCNCKVSTSNSETGSKHSREWKRGHLMAFECTKHVICGYLYFFNDNELCLLMQHPLFEATYNFGL